jgi:hypothetical protein
MIQIITLAVPSSCLPPSLHPDTNFARALFHAIHPVRKRTDRTGLPSLNYSPSNPALQVANLR